MQCRNEHGVEVDRPEAVVGFLKTDVLIGERVGDVQQLVREAERAARGDLLDEEVAGILERREPRRQPLSRAYQSMFRVRYITRARARVRPAVPTRSEKSWSRSTTKRKP